MERKCISLEVKDLDKEKRTATIAHATYDNVDRVKDISRKGMFNKSWSEGVEEISLYKNHDDTLAPGRVEGVFEDNSHAFTKAWFGTHTLGNDTLIMLDEKVIKWASFGYITTKSNNISVKGEQVRELKEVKHIETSVLTKMPANPGSRIVAVNKALIPEIKALTQPEFSILKQIAAMDNDCLRMLMQLASEIDETSDLYNWILWNISRRADMMTSIRGQLAYNAPEMKAIQDHITICEKFIKDTKASDDCIKSVMQVVDEYKIILSSSKETEPERKDDKGDFQKKLLLLSTKMTVQSLGATG